MSLNFLKLALAATAAFAIHGAVAHADVQASEDQVDNQSEVLQTPNCQVNNPDDSIACQAREACLANGTQDQACHTYCADFSNDALCQVPAGGEQVMWGRGGWHGGHGGWHGGGWHGGGWGPGRGFCFYHPYAPRCRY